MKKSHTVRRAHLSGAKFGITVFALLALLLAASPSFGITLDTVNWAADNSIDGTGTGLLDGITLTYTTATGFNAGVTYPEGWPSYTGTSAATSVTFQLGGVLGGGSSGTTETVSFSAPVVKPVLLVNFLGGLEGGIDGFPDGDSFDFGGNSFSVLSSFSASASANTVSASGSETDSADDGYAIQFDGTFGPGTPLSFTYTSDGNGPDGLQTVAFTVGIPSATTAGVPEPMTATLGLLSLGGLGLGTLRRRAR